MTTGINVFVLDRLVEGEHEPIAINPAAVLEIAAEIDQNLDQPHFEAMVTELLALSQVLELEESSPSVAQVLVDIIDRKQVLDELVARRPISMFEKVVGVKEVRNTVGLAAPK